MRIPTLDIDRILNIFGGGVEGCAAAIHSAGFEIDVRAMRKWRERNRIPMSGWLIINHTHELMHGHPLNLQAFIKR